LHKVRGSEYGYDGDPQAFLLVRKPSVSASRTQFDPLFAVIPAS